MILVVEHMVIYLKVRGQMYRILMYQSNRSFNILPPPPGKLPGHLNFWKIFVQIPPSPGRKAVQMPPPLGKLPYMPRTIFSKIIRYKSSLNSFKYGKKVVQAFGFRPLRNEYASSPLNSSKFVSAVSDRGNQRDS